MRKPVEPMLCERGIVFVPSGRGFGRVVCPAEGSGMVYGVFRGGRSDVTLAYYALLSLFYGVTSFAVLSAWHFVFSRRRGGGGTQRARPNNGVHPTADTTALMLR